MNNKKLRIIVRTALLLALLVVVQIAGRNIPNNNFIVGPLVNMILLVAAINVGLGSGLTLAILSPFFSLINNHAPVATALLPFTPVIAVANVILVIAFYFLYNKNKYAAIGAAAVLKFGFLFFAIRVFLQIFDFPKFATKLIALFSWPQLITAMIGGILAIPVIYSLSKALKNN